ncbi:MAG: YabP/YqfC family sporulation protein [Oscillospiraceae bacterium]|nr:YabP/YqfC family sporulation protein [Oscillospiraceae bacterium]
MKLYDKVRGRIPEMLNLPDQTLPGVPIIEIYGDRRVLIEGRCGVVQYGDKCIQLRNACGIVRICGHNLCVVELSGRQIIITGRVEGVSIFRG